MTQPRIAAVSLRQWRRNLSMLGPHSLQAPLPSTSPYTSMRYLSSGWGKGQDMLAGSLAMGIKPKTILDSYGTSGFDVINVIKKLDKDEISKSGTLLMNGSILAFPHSCFLWKMEDISEVTIESLAPVILHRPKVEYLFLGSDTPMQLDKMRQLKNYLREYNITFEHLDLANTMGTFNILNGEDRVVAAALIVPKEPEVVLEEEGATEKM